MAWLFLIVVCGIAIYCNWKRYWQPLKPVRVWFRKQLINNPFLFGVVIVFGGILIAFGLLFYNNLYPLIKSLYGLIPEDEFGDIKVDDDGFRNISLLIAGSATFSFAVLGMFLSVIRSILTRQQNNISQQGQITESMGRAIDQIGEFNGKKPNVEVRLGGLYSLQFIMQDSPRHEESIAKIFSTYVRENTKKDENEKRKQSVTKKSIQEIYDQKIIRYAREDVQAALDIISRFNKAWKEKGKEFSSNMKIDFSRSDFRGYSLAYMNFSGAILADVDFSSTHLVDVNLSNTSLIAADFSNAILANANLSDSRFYITQLPNAILFNANLSSAQLVGTNLFNASFLQANLKDTDLTGANLRSADLSGAKNLTQEQISNVYGDRHTKIPKGLTRPESWGEYEED